MDAGGGRTDRLDAGGKLRGIRVTGDRAHLCARRCELIDQRAADIAGCARDKNCVHATKDEAAPEKSYSADSVTFRVAASS